MVKSEDIHGFGKNLKNLSNYYKSFYDSLRRLKDENVSKSLVQKSEEYLKNMNDRLEKLKKVYSGFTSEICVSCENYMNKMNAIEEEDKKEVEGLKNDFEKVKEEMKEKNKELNQTSSILETNELSFIYRGNVKSKVDIKLAMNNSGSYFYREYISGRRTAEGDIFIDHDSENDELIEKYMNDDMSLIDDVKKMTYEERSRFLDDLQFFYLPIKKNLIKEIDCSEDNRIMEAWRDRHIMVNGKNGDEFATLLKSKDLFETLFNNQIHGNIQYSDRANTFLLSMNMKFYEVIVDYLNNDNKINTELIKDYVDKNDAEELFGEMKMVGIELEKKERNEIEGYFRYIKDSSLLDDKQYHYKLREWFGSDRKWKLLYRASKDGYTASSFHSCCNGKGPTLVVIKSTEGWIFGGYTTQSWSSNSGGMHMI